MNRKKMLIFLPMIYLLMACSTSVKETIGVSSKYSKEDIQEAMSIVKSDHSDFLRVGKPVSLVFDESESKKAEQNFLPILSSYESKKDSDILILTSEIRTGLFSGSLSPMTTYSDFYWILKKDTHNWEIIYGNFLN